MKIFKNKKGEGMISNFIILIIFLVAMSSGGLIAGIIYYDLTLIDTTFHTINFAIPQSNTTALSNTSIADFQDILDIVLYPVLGLKDSIPYLSYYMVFAFIIALAVTAYVSIKNPVFFVLHLLFLLLITYFCLIISNTYASLLADPFINAMMLPFTIYNKLMLYLPQVMFFTGLLFGIIAFVNVIKPKGESSERPTYGGDY